jgi:transcription initiation factor IIF auxiliary subunit
LKTLVFKSTTSLTQTQIHQIEKETIQEWFKNTTNRGRWIDTNGTKVKFTIIQAAEGLLAQQREQDLEFLKAMIQDRCRKLKQKCQAIQERERENKHRKN